MKKCKTCDKEFIEKNKRHIFCNRKCVDIFHGRGKHKELRNKIVVMLGGKCVICGETNIFMLDIDHINNNRQQDKLYNKDKKQLYRKLLTNPIIAKHNYQILCCNHNALKSRSPETFKALLLGIAHQTAI